MDNRLLQLCYEYFGDTEFNYAPVPAQGSNRNYYIVKSDREIIVATLGDNYAENRAFIYLARNFRSKGLSVPEILAVSDDGMAYLQSFVGRLSLFDFIESGRKSGEFSSEQISKLQEVISILPRVQFLGAENLDFGKCYPVESFDKNSIFWDLNYFKYCFLKTSSVQIDEPALEQEFELIARHLLNVKDSFWGFMIRDFQSRNVMLDDNLNVSLIDFQGGRRGPIFYDLASFLWQAKASFPEELRLELIHDYWQNLIKMGVEISRDEFDNVLKWFVIFRLLQVLGAYGFRGRFEKKQHFIESILPALQSLNKELQNSQFDTIPVLRSMIETILKKELDSRRQSDHLVVIVGSFSFKKGIPEDKSGNGGGFVFDCRGLHNPGRYDEYKPLTGKDTAVIDFLDQVPSVATFLEAAYTMVDLSVATYLRRGFTSLHVWFGCTGGRHRSVYSAEHMARHLSEHFPEAEIRLIHREQPHLNK